MIETFYAASCLNFGPNRWWQFKDKPHGGITRAECIQSADQIRFKLDLGRNLGSPSEHFFKEQHIEIDGTLKPQYLWLRSLFGGKTFTWSDGFLIPTIWKVGDSISATSRESNCILGHPIRITLTLTRVGIFDTPPYGVSLPPDRRPYGMEIGHTVRDIVQGTKLSEGKTFFAAGLGIFFASGINFGVFYLLLYEAGSFGAH